MTSFHLFRFRLLIFAFGVFFLFFSAKEGAAKPIVSPSNNEGEKGLAKGAQKLVMPSMARKAGGTWRKPEPELSGDKPEITSAARGSLEDSNHGSSSTSDYDSYEDSEDEEVHCPRKMFYHLRGQRCVPERCYGGNKMRNPATGECIQGAWDNPTINMGVVWGKNMSHYRRNPYVYRTKYYYKKRIHNSVRG